MSTEERVIKASILAGVTELIIAMFMFITGGHAWYYERFHMFGILGVGMLAYGGWHMYLHYRDTGNHIWQPKQY